MPIENPPDTSSELFYNDIQPEKSVSIFRYIFRPRIHANFISYFFNAPYGYGPIQAFELTVSLSEFGRFLPFIRTNMVVIDPEYGNIVDLLPLGLGYYIFLKHVAFAPYAKVSWYRPLFRLLNNEQPVYAEVGMDIEPLFLSLKVDDDLLWRPSLGVVKTYNLVTEESELIWGIKLGFGGFLNP